MLNPLGRNWGPLVNWDSLGKFYAAFAIIWTVVLYAGIIWLVTHRHVQYVRMRNITLIAMATTFLHVYLIKILLAYTTNGNFLCSAEFWIMSIYLPFGIALFQANTVQLLSISVQQRKLLDGFSIRDRARSNGIHNLWSRWRGLNTLRQTYVFIGIGLVLQVVVTAAIYGTNEKLQGQWGHIAKPAGQIKCRKGPEWIPSSFWQLFWSAVFGPYILFRLRKVRDIHYWRLQTILSVISGIPGTPLWLAAVFSPKFKPINKYWVPPMWLAPGILVMQAVTVFFPIYDYYTSNHRFQTGLSALHDRSSDEAWRDPSTQSPQFSSGTFNSDNASHSSSSNTTQNNKCKSMYSLSGLERVLSTDPSPLLHFAATKDFTAENIIFLLSVRNFRASFAAAATTTPHGRNTMFNQAVDIYTQSVSEKYAEFPINVESSIRAHLDSIFASAVSNVVQASSSESLDFDSMAVPLSPLSMSRIASHTQEKEGGGYGFGNVHVPEGFDEKVFDAAEKSIKYLVVTNTWRKYVSGMRNGRVSEESH